MAGMRDELGLTPRQRAFVENVLKGQSLAQSYRDAYSPKTMTPGHIRTEAARTAALPHVTRALQVRGEEMARDSRASTISDRDTVLSLLRSWVTGDREPTSAQLKSAELLGRAAGLYREVVEDHRERPAALVAAELQARLAGMIDTGDRTDGVAVGGDSLDDEMQMH